MVPVTRGFVNPQDAWFAAGVVLRREMERPGHCLASDRNQDPLA